MESPAVAGTLRLVLAESRYVAVSGRVERTHWHRSLIGQLVRPLPLLSLRSQLAAYGLRLIVCSRLRLACYMAHDVVNHISTAGLVLRLSAGIALLYRTFRSLD